VYTREFKIEALQLLARGGKSAAELERELGITKGMLLKWRDRYRVDEQRQSLEPSDLEAARAEVRRLRRELEVTAQERDILKKAVAIFSHKDG
jgi:transposase